MSNKKTIFAVIQLSLVLLVVVVLVSGGTFAYWQWVSDVDKEVVFNTVDGYEQYIVYDPGESHFVGDFKETSSFCESISTTLSVYKTISDVDFSIAINMDVNAIESSISSSSSVYWVVTRGGNNITCPSGTEGLLDTSVVNYGTFVGKGSSFVLTDDLKVTSGEQQYTVWIWIQDDTNLTVGETLDTNIWSQINMLDKQEDLVGDAYAVYSATDGSLRFYRSNTAITAGSTYNGLTATAVYTGFENKGYSSTTTPPWHANRANITSVYFEDVIRPTSLAYWFYYLEKAQYFDVSNLDTSNVTSMAGAFFRVYNGLTGSFTIDGLEEWDTAKVTDMSYLFHYAATSATSVDIGSLENFDTGKVTTMVNMFNNFAMYDDTYDIGNISGWDTSSVTDMNNMFYYNGRYSTTFIMPNISGWDTSKVTNMSKMLWHVGYADYGDWTIDLSSWNVCRVTSYDEFIGNGQNPIVEPSWGMACP